jgi:hypothetical protein
MRPPRTGWRLSPRRPTSPRPPCSPRGLTNSEIADRLFLSPRIVASHLYRSYPKLGIAGRHQLRDLLDQATDRHRTPPPHG